MKEFRMAYKEFYKIVDMLFSYNKIQDTNMRGVIPIKKAIAGTLH
jgi:hypothetical protein